MSHAPTLELENGETIALPFRWEICDCCNGHGKSSAHLGAFTASEWAETDMEFREDYMRGGYDRECEECNGHGKVKVVDFDKLTKEQKRILKEQRRAERECAMEAAHERRQLGGY